MIIASTLRRQCAAVLAGLGIAGAAAAQSGSYAVEGPMHGEWATQPELCAETRLAFTADGRHQILWNDDGDWKVQSEGVYHRDGSRLEIRLGETRQMRQIISVDDQFLVLRDLDQSRSEALEGEALTLYRCPAR